MALAHLKLCARDLTAAHQAAVDAAVGLFGANESAEQIADALLDYASTDE